MWFSIGIDTGTEISGLITKFERKTIAFSQMKRETWIRNREVMDIVKQQRSEKISLSRVSWLVVVTLLPCYLVSLRLLGNSKDIRQEAECVGCAGWDGVRLSKKCPTRHGFLERWRRGRGSKRDCGVRSRLRSLACDPGWVKSQNFSGKKLRKWKIAEVFRIYGEKKFVSLCFYSSRTFARFLLFLHLANCWRPLKTIFSTSSCIHLILFDFKKFSNVQILCNLWMK